MKAIKKKMFLSVMASLVACLMFATPVLAAGSFSKTTAKLNAVNGNISNISSLSSGSVSGTNPSITSVSVYVNVSSGSDPYYIHIISPEGTEYIFEGPTTNKTITIPVFNGENPKGTWYVYIENLGYSYNPNQIFPASTATITLKVSYM